MDGTQHGTTPTSDARDAHDARDVSAGLRDPHTRRGFLRAAGLGGMTLVAGGALAACTDTSTSPLAPEAVSFAVVRGNNVTLDFSSDIDILNYAYALEQLEAAFYTQVVATAGYATRFSDSERRILTNLRDHEIVHREFLKAALGTAAIPALSVDFSSVNFTSRTSVLQTAQAFEDLGVGAYNGAAKYLRSATFLTLAGKIVSVEARHASAIRAVLAGNRTAAFAPDAFDPAFAPSQVLAAADPFIVQNITVINA
jgi:rubrerythrin